MSRGSPPLVLVAGIGNPDRGDDGFAAAVMSRLHGQVPPRVRLLARSGDPLALIDDWTGFDTVVLVDAAAVMTEPGRVHRLDLASGPLPVGWSPSSTHALGLGEAIELARSLGRLPRQLILYLAESASFRTGTPLSPAVAAAVGAVAGRILSELSTFLPPDQPVGAAVNA